MCGTKDICENCQDKLRTIESMSFELEQLKMEIYNLEMDKQEMSYEINSLKRYITELEF